MQLQLSLIERQINDCPIPQRASDGFINATAMCQAAGKLWGHYRALQSTEEFLSFLSADIGIPISGLVVTLKGGSGPQGTWVHPDVAVSLAQWCSPKFAVAVSRWVREWLSGKFTTAKLPYHLERYMVNRAAIPPTHWSMLNELTFHLIAPLESAGYRLPDNLVPDISTGRMFSKWLRDVKGIETDTLPQYRHIYEDGRVVLARLYPLSLLEDFRLHFFNVWLPEKAVHYFHVRDPKALEFLTSIYLLPENPSVDDATAKAKFDSILGKLAAIPDPAAKPNDQQRLL